MVVDDADPVGSDDHPVRIVSFPAFYEAEYRPMVRLAVALVGRRDVAEELVQDAFVTLARPMGSGVEVRVARGLVATGRDEPLGVGVAAASGRGASPRPLVAAP